MKLAAAHAIAGVVGDDLQAEYIIPSVFNRDVAPAVATAVSAEARASGLAREFSDLIDPLHVDQSNRELAT
jgi:malate dehydrogenase (oxaloacetate-decarboxylating)